MNKLLDELINDESLSELSGYFQLFNNSDYVLEGTNKVINICYSTKELLTIGRSSLLSLNNWKRPRIKGLKYFNNCGVISQNYGEIYLDIMHKDDPSFGNFYDWNDNKLVFDIGTKRFEVSCASPLFVLLTEPIYRDSELLYDFENFLTIKIFNTDENTLKDDLNKSLFYLNSFYLKPLEFVTKVNTLKCNFDSELTEDYLFDKSEMLTRKRIRKRDDFEVIEPLSLYNRAQLQIGEVKFLYLYRILEFFMRRAQLLDIHEKRHDETIEDEELIKVFEKKGEQDRLRLLLNQVCRPTLKKRISNYAFSKKLIKNNDFSVIAKQMYGYRNSLVHAKEEAIMNTEIPDILECNSRDNFWVNIVELISLECIKKYNKKH